MCTIADFFHQSVVASSVVCKESSTEADVTNKLKKRQAEKLCLVVSNKLDTFDDVVDVATTKLCFSRKSMS